MMRGRWESRQRDRGCANGCARTHQERAIEDTEMRVEG